MNEQEDFNKIEDLLRDRPGSIAKVPVPDNEDDEDDEDDDEIRTGGLMV